MIALLSATTLAGVVINEVEQNPRSDENARKAAERAWIELYNNGIRMRISVAGA